MNWLAAKAWELGLAALLFALAIGLGLYWGHGWGQRAQAHTVATLTRDLGLMTSSRDSWQRLAADRMAAVAEQNRANAQAIERAKLDQLAARAAERRADTAAKDFLEARARLAKLTQEDTANCPVHPICGSPLE